ncbi:hemagglutinin repeat-containing protein [Avibacterium avium]|uniref:hemagglutinin repeat-containing protein n=1 Tax=Avibacterium avium TaxID=751 RepID=UPI0039FBC041
MEQKGFTIAVNIPVVQAVQNALAVAEQAKQVGESKNSRVNAMATANTAWSAYRAGQGLMKAGQTLSQMANGNMAQGAMNASVSITYGEQKNVQTTDTQGNSTTGSEVNAGGKVTIQATDAGKESDINVVGSDVSGKQGTTFLAEDEVNFLAAKQTHQERSKNKSSGFNAGVAVSYGSDGFAFGITAGGNYGKGYGNGDETTWRGSHIGDKASQTVIQSGGDTTLRGAQVQGKGIRLDTENLNIESLQDTMSYEGKQMNVSGQVTAGYGFSASASYNQSKMNADYASVQEQSGIFAGDEGYQIDVRKHTDLKGGLITSTAQAEADNKNSFSTGTLSYSDIINYSNHSASGFGLSGGITVSGGDAPKEIGGMKLQQIGQNHQDGSAKVEYSGVAGLGSQGNWGITKGIATGLLGQVKDKGSETGITTSSINTTNITIRNRDTQQKLAGKTVEESLQGLTKINLHQGVEKADIETIRSDLERDLNTATEFVNNFNNQGDEIHYKMEKNEDSLFSIQPKTEACNHISCLDFDKDNSQALKKLIYSEELLTEEQAKLLSKVATAGMLNLTREQKVSSAILYDKDLSSINDTALILNRGSAGILNEVLFTGFERFRAWANIPSLFGASNATRDHAQIAKKLDEYNAYAKSHGAKTYTFENVAQEGETGRIDTRIYKDVYFVHHPQANNALSELLVAGYEKMIETTFGTVFGMDNSSLQAKALMKKYGQDNLFVGSHSRDTLTVTNALNSLNTTENREAKLLSGTTIKMVGPAANVTYADGILSRLQTGKERTSSESSIRIENHQQDPVGRVPIILGGNLPTMNDNLQNRGGIQRIIDMFGDNSSMHNCYGLGQSQCVTDGYRKSEDDLIMNKEQTIFELNKQLNQP